MMESWDDLEYWKSGEWDVVQERLDDLKKAKKVCNPKREDLFAALDAVSLQRTKVIILGQDPYPSHQYATGYAFSIPKKCTTYPPTLKLILDEYQSDLNYTDDKGKPILPKSGDLTKWSEQGVLLWNVIPSCENGKSMSHDWPEWELLTKEILEVTTKHSTVVAALGSCARRYLKYVDQEASETIITSHPSPRGLLASRRSSVPSFVGSRLFSTINTKLHEQGVPCIDWRL